MFSSKSAARHINMKISDLLYLLSAVSAVSAIPLWKRDSTKDPTDETAESTTSSPLPASTITSLPLSSSSPSSHGFNHNFWPFNIDIDGDVPHMLNLALDTFNWNIDVSAKNYITKKVIELSKGQHIPDDMDPFDYFNKMAIQVLDEYESSLSASKEESLNTSNSEDDVETQTINIKVSQHIITVDDSDVESGSKTQDTGNEGSSTSEEETNGAPDVEANDSVETTPLDEQGEPQETSDKPSADEAVSEEEEESSQDEEHSVEANDSVETTPLDDEASPEEGSNEDKSDAQETDQPTADEVAAPEEKSETNVEANTPVESTSLGDETTGEEEAKESE
ncbi:hypothetical protein H4219_004330 [Mycoemilia scoparia]|uniref:Uncharacterized protein n=1 Tax=Mycoemilia scoparia TaxID=417184 RepID=A0A9W7ZWJ9_9FUNG|nr:hypothetical protein H4219_004330 [Mycoemilia scoparia]